MPAPSNAARRDLLPPRHRCQLLPGHGGGPLAGHRGRALPGCARLGHCLRLGWERFAAAKPAFETALGSLGTPAPSQAGAEEGLICIFACGTAGSGPHILHVKRRIPRSCGLAVQSNGHVPFCMAPPQLLVLAWPGTTAPAWLSCPQQGFCLAMRETEAAVM